MDRFSYAIFCDDIRQEVNNKTIYIGTYDNEILIPDDEYVMSNFSVSLVFCTEPNDEIEKIDFCFDFPDQDPVIFSPDFDLPESSDSVIRSKLSVNANFKNLLIKAGSKISTHVVVDGEKIVGDRIHIRKMEASTSP